jgi:hypothetical protein
MPEELPERLLRAIRANPDGLGIDAIIGQLGADVARRTVLRRLDDLIASGEVQRTGKARATRYHVAEKAAEKIHEPTRVTYAEEREAWYPSVVREEPPVYATSGEDTLRELRDYFRTPYSLRKPCGYRREFLDAYIPNDTTWLPVSLREHLRSKGQSAEMAELPPGTYARQVLDRLIIDLSWNSSRLEGNTYSLLETDFLLQQGRSEDPVRFKDAQMILNHKAAIEFLVESPDDLGFNRYTFMNLHAVLTDGLLRSSKSLGAIRTIAVGIGGSVFHPTNNFALIEECFDLILEKARAIRDPLECCFFLMTQMPYLQPFEDGNKRTSRLAANIPLIQANMSPLSFVDVPVRGYTDGILAIYELNRIELMREVFEQAYLRSAERYAAIRQELGDPEPLVVRYRMEIKEFIRDIVVKRLSKLEAAELLRRWIAKNVTASDRAKLTELIEEQLLSLRASSIARVRVRPSEFEAWWPVWSGSGKTKK